MRRGASKREEAPAGDASRPGKMKTKTVIFLRLENFRSLILMGLTWNSNSGFAIRNLACFWGFLSPTLRRAWAGDRGASCSSLIESLHRFSRKPFQLLVRRAILTPK